MGDGQKGVLVRMVLPLCDAARHLRPDDVIKSFDGVQVANDGTVPFRRATAPRNVHRHGYRRILPTVMRSVKRPSTRTLTSAADGHALAVRTCRVHDVHRPIRRIAVCLSRW